VRLLRLPGDRRAMVDAETAELGERMGEFKRLEQQPVDPEVPVQPMRLHSRGVARGRGSIERR
jgi:hypothetical protein